MKNKYTILGLILVCIGLAFLIVALSNPQLSFPWENWATYTIYGLYIAFTVLVFCMPRFKDPSLLACLLLGIQFAALACIIISIGLRAENNECNWFLPLGLALTAVANISNAIIQKKKKQE